MSLSSTAPVPCRRSFDSHRLQLGVIVFVLTMAVSWVVTYATVMNSPMQVRELSPALARQLHREHAAEFIRIEAQAAEAYGSGTLPAPSGS